MPGRTWNRVRGPVFMILALGGPRVAHLPSLSLSLSRGKRWGGRGKGGCGWTRLTASTLNFLSVQGFQEVPRGLLCRSVCRAR